MSPGVFLCIYHVWLILIRYTQTNSTKLYPHSHHDAMKFNSMENSHVMGPIFNQVEASHPLAGLVVNAHTSSQWLYSLIGVTKGR